MTVSPSMPAAPALHPASARRSMRVRLSLWLTLLIATLALLPFDQTVSTWASSLEVPHDIDQELRFVQQFGQIGSLVIVAVLVWMLQTGPIRRSLLDLGLSILVVVGVGLLLKTLFGRVRPAFGTADQFFGVGRGEDAAALTWPSRTSFPSSHTAAAVVLATWLWYVFPRIRWVGVVLAILVGIARVRFDAHWPSDVTAGALLATVATSIIVRRQIGTWTLDVLWKSLVDRNARACWPDVRAAIEERQPRGDQG